MMLKKQLNLQKLNNVCQIANDNAPGQIVISGEINAVDHIIDF